MALSTNLVSYWKLNGNSNDAVGSNNGTDTAISYVTGLLSNAASFNGTSSKIDFGNPSSLQFSGAFSISAWIKTPGGSNFSTIFAKRNNTPFNGYLLAADDSTGKINFILKGTSQQSFDSSNTYAANTWTHVVCTIDASGNVAVYLNNTKTTGSYTGGTYTETATNAYIGAAQGGAAFFNNGIVDEVGVWSRQLTDAEVTQLFNGGAGITYPFGSSYSQNNTETLTIAASMLRVISRLITAQITSTDSALRTMARILANSISLAASVASGYVKVKNLVETLTVSASRILKLNGSSTIWRTARRSVASVWKDTPKSNF